MSAAKRAAKGERAAAFAVLAVLAVALLGAEARAYPHLQLSSGSGRCSECHVGPAGGGLLTPWGQDEHGDTVARGGDGRFLHGAVELPGWLQLGGNLRLAALANDTGGSEGAELAAFPMQIDLAVRVAAGAWSAVVVGGLRGVVRGGAPADNPGSEASAPPLASYLVSREHYVMWRPGETGAYARAGRFAAPHGLRLADHTAYVRRYLGHNLLDETYGLGGGWIADTWELHATAFASDPLQGAPRREVGGAALFEARPARRAEGRRADERAPDVFVDAAERDADGLASDARVERGRRRGTRVGPARAREGQRAAAVGLRERHGPDVDGDPGSEGVGDARGRDELDGQLRVDPAGDAERLLLRARHGDRRGEPGDDRGEPVRHQVIRTARRRRRSRSSSG